jgi:hypothetical protein
MRIRTAIWVVCLLSTLHPGLAGAQALEGAQAPRQTVELGVGLALSCKSVEYSFCTYKWGRVDAVHGAWWRSPSLVFEVRAARLDGPATRVVAVTERVSENRYFSRSYTLRDERRTALLASMLYHFRPGRTLRPFIGAGTGVMWWRGDAFCDRDQIDCRSVLPEQGPGVLDAREWIVSFAGGLAVEAGRGVLIRGGSRETTIPTSFGRWGNDSVRRRAARGQLPEYFLSVGYRW